MKAILKALSSSLVAAVALASSAGAATFTLTPSGSSFQVNDTVTLSLTGTLDGSEVASFIFVEIDLAQGAGTWNGASQNPLPSGGWLPSPTPCPNANGRCTLVNQQPPLPSPDPLPPTPLFELATAQLILDTPGIVEVRGVPGGTLFGLDPAGLSSGEITVVPEPGIAGLLGVALGVGGVATRRRRLPVPLERRRTERG